jgi:hypothetical protein
VQDVAGAKAAFARAHAISAVVNGKDNSSTLQLQALAEDTPTTVEQLQSHAYYKYSVTDAGRFQEL